MSCKAKTTVFALAQSQKIPTAIMYMTSNLQKRVDTVSLNEKRRKEEREEVKRGWLPGRGLNPNYLVMQFEFMLKSN